MAKTIVRTARIAPDAADRESRESGETLRFYNDFLPPPAEQYQITDLQHWIDLCA